MTTVIFRWFAVSLNLWNDGKLPRVEKTNNSDMVILPLVFVWVGLHLVRSGKSLLLLWVLVLSRNMIVAQLDLLLVLLE
jgi:hypothetical protein